MLIRIVRNWVWLSSKGILTIFWIFFPGAVWEPMNLSRFVVHLSKLEENNDSLAPNMLIFPKITFFDNFRCSEVILKKNSYFDTIQFNI